MYSLTGRETVTVDIGIIEDDKFEQAEVFCAILSFINIRRNVTITPHHTEIVISDDDSELLLTSLNSVASLYVTSE